MSEEIDLEELKRQTSHGDRLDSDADNDQQQALADAILTELERIDAGEEQKTVSIWDGPTAAYIRALDEHPDQRAEVGDALRRQLDIDGDEPVDRSELVRFALRLGFRQAAPDKFETLKESVQKHVTQDL
ncbi:hypothetical protein [Halocatena marina]|uniref:DUF8115 domain-containing protein n=1 Tax=Halocatena marina TaxID=2934937 RepID=A0ABD5YTL0_9EURY|nr:hypothetical protein [Halocatena marina]